MRSRNPITVLPVFAAVAAALFLPVEALSIRPSVEPTPSPTPIQRQPASTPVYQPKTAPAPTGTPTMKPPVYTAAGPQSPTLAKESLVGMWTGSVTMDGSRAIYNGFRFLILNGDLNGFWLNGSEEQPIKRENIVITGTTITIKISQPDYAVTFTGYMTADKAELRGTTLIDSLGQKSKGTWAAKRTAAAAHAAPTTARELVSRGQELLGKKDYVSALQLFNQAVTADPEYIEGYRMRAITALLIYEQNPRTEGQKLYTALFNFDDAIKRGSTNPDDYYFRGQTHEKIGDKTKAAADYRLALKFSPAHKGANDALSKLGLKP